MQFLAWSEIKTKVQEKVDIQDEVFISPAELLRYCHDAIDYTEAEIHKFNVADKYFESVAPIEVLAGIQNYQMPANIYANKILKVMKNARNDVYEIKRLTRLNRYQDSAFLEAYGDSNEYSYMIINDSANTKPVMRFFPRPTSGSTASVTTNSDGTAAASTITVSSASGIIVDMFVQQPSLSYGANIPEGARVEAISGNTITLSTNVFQTHSGVATKFLYPDYLMYYIRNANKPTLDAHLVDIPEFSAFIVQWLIVEALKKDVGNPRLVEEKERFQDLKEQMVSTLSGMVIDQNDKVEIDMSINWEMS